VTEYDSSAVKRIITLPPNHDLSVWLYESLRQVLLELSFFIGELGVECNSTSCPKMCATENWAFLCAAHPPEPGKKAPPKECCAIDWCTHALTGFNALMNSADEFPNRYTINPKSARHFGEMSRRLYRVFAHAFYHHRAFFDQIEVHTYFHTYIATVCALKCLSQLPHCLSVYVLTVSSQSRTHLTQRFIQFCLHFELMAPAQLVPPIEGMA
jgi:hypothetical protein